MQSYVNHREHLLVKNLTHQNHLGTFSGWIKKKFQSSGGPCSKRAFNSCFFLRGNLLELTILEDKTSSGLWDFATQEWFNIAPTVDDSPAVKVVS